MIKNKGINKRVIMLALTLFILVLSIITIFSTKAVAMNNNYYTLDFSSGLVTASILNIRQGPGTNFKIIGTVNKDEYVRVFAGIGDWYVIQTNSDLIGVVSKNYIKAVKSGQAVTPTPMATSTPKPTATPVPQGGTGSGTVTLTDDEKATLELINAERRKQGLSDLKVDSELQNVARIKAKEMVDKGYFSHTSPTYGSPFDMMKKFGISYKTAGENIAGNSSNQAAVTAWMNSEGHRANILNSSFNYTGLAVVSSPKYGKMYVQMFIGR